ncbi:hypothetical protein BK011_02000 [Tenericutes bacterium MZ-XQ]|nr:hypothetical protein BK011_02000 [Tenericutes bacterium MZ-XQ]
MKRPWILIILGILVILTLMLTYNNNDENFLPIYEDTEIYSEALIKTGANESDYTPYQTWVIYNQEDLSYVKKFHEEAYTGLSSNPVVFMRDWGEASKVDWDQSLDLETDISLFESDQQYLIILTFEIPYVYTTSQNQIGYIDIRHSNNFYISSSLHISYVDDNKEYILSATSLFPNNHLEMIPIYQNTTPINQIIKPSLIYTYIFNVHPTSDNDLGIDMYLGMDIDIYMPKPNTNNAVQIGFNEFKEANHIFLVTRKSVQYRKEISQ